MFRPVKGLGFEGITDERRPPCEDDEVRYFGQDVAVAVADTFEQAKAAADAVRVIYAAEKPDVDRHLKPDGEPKEESKRGDPDNAIKHFAEALRLRPGYSDAQRALDEALRRRQ